MSQRNPNYNYQRQRNDKSPPPESSAPQSSEPRHVSMLALGIFFFALLITVVFIVIFTRPQPKHNAPVANETLGGTWAQTAGIPFVDQYALNVMAETMTNITNGCSPTRFPSPAPIYNVLKVGTLAATRSSWAQLKQSINGTGAGQCLFYGLEEVEFHAQMLEGPADLCHAYVSATLQFFTVNNLTAVQQADLPYTLSLGLLVAYPLNLYWENSLGLNWQINLGNQLNTYIVRFQAGLLSGQPSADTDVQTIATGFCNMYFATDQPAYYSAALQAQLAFAWEGMVNRLSKSVTVNALQNSIGEFYITSNVQIKAIYIIAPTGLPGADLPNDPALQLFIQSMLPGIPVTIITDPPLTALSQINFDLSTSNPSIPINTSLAPVMVFACYVDDPQTYSSAQDILNSLLFAFWNHDPAEVLGGANLGVVLQNAEASASMSVFDFEETLSFEYMLGASFQPQKTVADIVNLIYGTYVYAGTVSSFGLLDTFAIKNTLVNGYDVGGRYDGVNAGAAITAAGVSLGLKRHAFSMELSSNVLNTSGYAYMDMLSGSTSTTLPASFDWGSQSPSCMPPSVNQGNCESCWAISVTRAMGSRVCIFENPAIGPRGLLSIQQVVSCSTNLITNTDGCNPQYPSTAFTFLSGDVTTFQCMPVIDAGTTASGCPGICKGGGPPPVGGGVIGGSFAALHTAADIKAELVAKGPLAVGITVPTDLLNYFPVNTPVSANVIYPISANTQFIPNGGHMMMLRGYDDTTNPPCWIILNSWGDKQGVGGVIRLAQDVNNVLKGKVPWVDTQGFTAKPRTAPTNPVTVLLSSQTTTSTTQNVPNPGTVKSVYTATVSCPNMILNTKQANASAAIQGCPNSASAYMQSKSGAAHAGIRPRADFVAIMAVIVTLLASAMSL